MTATGAAKQVVLGPQIWPLSVKAYHALGEMAMVPEATELLYGQIFHEVSKSPWHSYLSEFLEDMLRAAVSSGCPVRGEEPLTFEDSEPEPDLAVVRGRREDFRQTHPTSAEFVIEVCVTSHDFDRSKLRAHAQAGVKEVWLVLGPEKQIEVHLKPAGEQFAESTVHGPGGTLISATVPGFTVDMETLFAG
jgi:Uma2 family endonuclease